MSQHINYPYAKASRVEKLEGLVSVTKTANIRFQTTSAHTHTHAHTYTHTHTHTHTHTYIHTHTHRYTQHADIHIHTYTYTHTIHTYIHTYMHQVVLNGWKRAGTSNGPKAPRFSKLTWMVCHFMPI
ncbi:hypothetical protein LOAG_12587 [Loa loa]|uniref:Uncharacterized protein n=1 Tax=Loa loa TaxID=7209 RepID=A0A1S0TL16_LOALO|nr:hypothetical protein LOAG_12587 [Loa loa]EFO15918.2 hypothetical protein LOAG_12587 [Loa loa]